VPPKTITPTPTRPCWATRLEVAQYLRKSPRTIDEWIARGYVQAYRLPGNRSLVIDLNEVDAVIRSRGPVVPTSDPAA